MNIRYNIGNYASIVIASILPIWLLAIEEIQSYATLNLPHFLVVVQSERDALLGLATSVIVLLSVILIVKTGDFKSTQIPVVILVILGGLTNWTTAWYKLTPLVEELEPLDALGVLVIGVLSLTPLLIQLVGALELPKTRRGILIWTLVGIPIAALLLVSIFDSPVGELITEIWGGSIVSDIVWTIGLIAVLLVIVGLVWWVRRWYQERPQE